MQGMMLPAVIGACSVCAVPCQGRLFSFVLRVPVVTVCFSAVRRIFVPAYALAAAVFRNPDGCSRCVSAVCAALSALSRVHGTMRTCMVRARHVDRIPCT
jgi:hypothetical protein